MAREHVELVRRAYEAYSKGDLAAAAAASLGTTRRSRAPSSA
ncbi:MAG TPA: hypothetical protein VGF25_05895 [Thermoleophilaceae bacterium]